ncbi:hypothetical protein [Corynebacterium glyciniphilum]|uniref:hypothetical protein n=1 Tax=Corynebacterium glyciniphilum TaxID=1404244 RepID=UPI001642A822|nr:hypothetical protein [Corynebacterium glyciniphilum]
MKPPRHGNAPDATNNGGEYLTLARYDRDQRVGDRAIMTSIAPDQHDKAETVEEVVGNE